MKVFDFADLQMYREDMKERLGDTTSYSKKDTVETFCDTMGDTQDDTT